jgi:deoxyribose-phosphate aldolase
MNNASIMAKVDHTLLKAVSTSDEITALCREALQHGAASVCIPPCYVPPVKKEFPSLAVCTVIGFPLGYSVKEAKVFEARCALEGGADELDMVVNLADVKNRNFLAVTEEIRALREACGSKVLKVIVETCYLDRDEKLSLLRAVENGGADFIKTSTGFGTGGADMDDILLFKQHISGGLKIKASGGIRTREDMVAFIEAGCDRLGTSSAVKILFEGSNGQEY